MIAFPDVTPGDDVVVSATLFTTYGRCPEQALGRVRGVYPTESRASFKGNLAHRIFARHLSAGPIAPDGLAQACREEIGQSLNPKIAALGMKPSDLSAVVREVGDLYERFKMLAAEGFEAAEVMLEATPLEGVTLRGSVDAVFGDAEVGTRLVDWKTGALYEVQDQLSFYGLLWVLERDELPGALEAVSVGTGERFTSTPTVADVEATAVRVAAMVSALRSAFAAGGEMERRGGGWCRYCPLLEGCAEGEAAAALFAR
jgi:hypothetical protein